jgi:hypothetical protein
LSILLINKVISKLYFKRHCYIFFRVSLYISLPGAKRQITKAKMSAYSDMPQTCKRNLFLSKNIMQIAKIHKCTWLFTTSLKAENVNDNWLASYLLGLETATGTYFVLLR